MEMGRHPRAGRRRPRRGRAWAARLYSRTGEDISESFPDLVEALRLPGAIDGELLIVREGRVQTFNVLQQRLNRKTSRRKLTRNFPRICAPTISWSKARGPARTALHRAAHAARTPSSRASTSRASTFRRWWRSRLGGARPAAPIRSGAGADADAVEGIMLKRRDAPYLARPPQGQWWKWKRDPLIIDAVLMYAQRGSGKRSSYYSDYTFGVWTKGEDGDVLVPVGKAYFGFTDEELLQIDRFVRRNTADRFGPVREVVHEADEGLVLEVAFEGLQRSTRHKSGVAMRFPRISRLRWDKPPREADRLDTARADAGEDRERPGSRPRRNRQPDRDDPHEPADGEADGRQPVTRFFGGPPLSVIFRLVLLSILIGVILRCSGSIR